MKEDNENRKEKLKSTHMHTEEFEVLKKRNEELQEMLLEYKEELQIKADLLINLPQILLKKEEEENNKTKLKEETIKRMESKCKKGIKRVQDENAKKMESLNQNQMSLLNEADNEIKEIWKQYEELKTRSTEENYAILNELITLNDLAEYFIWLSKSSIDKIKNDTNVNSNANLSSL